MTGYHSRCGCMSSPTIMRLCVYMRRSCTRTLRNARDPLVIRWWVNKRNDCLLTPSAWWPLSFGRLYIYIFASFLPSFLPTMMLMTVPIYRLSRRSIFWRTSLPHLSTRSNELTKAMIIRREENPLVCFQEDILRVIRFLSFGLLHVAIEQ